MPSQSPLSPASIATAFRGPRSQLPGFTISCGDVGCSEMSLSQALRPHHGFLVAQARQPCTLQAGEIILDIGQQMAVCADMLKSPVLSRSFTKLRASRSLSATLLVCSRAPPLPCSSGLFKWQSHRWAYSVMNVHIEEPSVRCVVRRCVGSASSL